VVAATGDPYLAARQGVREQQRSMTEAEKREVENAGRQARQAVTPFEALSIANHIEAATDKLNELVTDAVPTPEVLRTGGEADETWRSTLRMARQMLGVEEVD